MRHVHAGFHGHSFWQAGWMLMIAVLSLAGCASERPAAETGDIITVVGTATVRGNTPFEAMILETEDRNLYVLELDSARRNALMTPARLTVRGRLYLADWNGTPFAHLEVLSIN